MSKIETFVYSDTEVKKTGRTAIRTSITGVSAKELVLIEVTPVDEDNGTWKKWVQPGMLFQIVDPK